MSLKNVKTQIMWMNLELKLNIQQIPITLQVNNLFSQNYKQNLYLQGPCVLNPIFNHHVSILVTLGLLL